MGEENYVLNTSSFIPEYYSRIKDVAEFYGRSLNSQSVLFKKQGLVPIKLGSESFFYLKERIGRDYSHYMPFKYFKNTYGFDPEYCEFAEIEELDGVKWIRFKDDFYEKNRRKIFFSITSSTLKEFSDFEKFRTEKNKYLGVY